MAQTIALVDDDRNILTSVSMALEAEGFKVDTYADGDEALRGLCGTLGARSLHSHPEYLLFYRAAVGHVFGPDQDVRVAPVPFLDRGSGPAGATPFAAARGCWLPCRSLLRNSSRTMSRICILRRDRAVAVAHCPLPLLRTNACGRGSSVSRRPGFHRRN